MESTLHWNTKTKVEFLKKLPTETKLTESLGFRPEKFLVIFDKRLRKDELIGKWLREFPLVYAVDGGEKLKDMAAFPGHLRKILKLVFPFSSRSLCVIGLGGGSVGDFAGFLASVIKRGVPLVHIPTTLLAAMDSAHGGKTALNIADVKNQVGSFYPADAVYIVKNIFQGLPRLQLQSAGGELFKMALIEGGTFFDRFREEFKLDMDAIWELLPMAIEAKYRLVEKDPFERSGERQILNLGHTLGHALEAHYSLPHGIAVGEGLIFATLWSEHQGYFRGENSKSVLELLTHNLGFLQARDFAKKHRSLVRSKLERLISEDKKMTDTRHLNFIFIEDVGKPFRKKVTIESFLTETQRQGWTTV